MTSNASYNYDNRDGIHPISWNDFFGICKGLALAVAPYQPEIILGVARGGMYPATQIAHLLRIEFFPIRLTNRYKDEVVYDSPRWLVKPPEEVKGKRVLIVDEISSSGRTVNMVKDEVLALGAKEARIAVMYAHTWGTDFADYIGLISDALIMNPWDREILQAGEFVFHPEYAGALAEQGIAPDPSLLIGVEAVPAAKGGTA